MGFRWILRAVICLLVLGVGIYNYLHNLPGGGTLLLVGGFVALSTIWQLLHPRK